MDTVVDSMSNLKNKLERRYNSARFSILLVVILTVVNIVSMFFGGSIYFFFSAVIPMYTIMLGMLMGELFIGDGSGQALGNVIFFTMLAIGVVMILAYIMCWFFSKKHMFGWLIAALVMFSVDTLVILLFYIPTAVSSGELPTADSFALYLDVILNIGFHIWVIVDLSRGISAHFKLKKLPVTEVTVDENAVACEVVSGDDIPVNGVCADVSSAIAENTAENSVEVSDNTNFI